MADPDEEDPTGTTPGWLDPEAWGKWLSGPDDAGWWSWLADISTGWRGPEPRLPRIEDPDAFARERARIGQEDGVWPTAVERLVRHQPGRSRWSLVFLHGFGASRGGGEAILEPIAAERRLNAWLPLLPGHGRTPEHQAEAPAEAYLAHAAEALAMGRALGERVCLVGSSTGGLLATWLAARWPDHVHALVLASPFYAFADPTARVLRLPFGLDAVEAAYGPVRDASFQDPRREEGYDEHWLTEQRYRALGALERLRGWLAAESTYRRVRCPVLLLYTPSDDVVDLDAMHQAFGRMGPHRLSCFIPIEDGHHILLSDYVRTDKAAIRKALDAFLDDVGVTGGPGDA